MYSALLSAFPAKTNTLLNMRSMAAVFNGLPKRGNLALYGAYQTFETYCPTSFLGRIEMLPKREAWLARKRRLSYDMITRCLAVEWCLRVDFRGANYYSEKKNKSDCNPWIAYVLTINTCDSFIFTTSNSLFSFSSCSNRASRVLYAFFCCSTNFCSVTKFCCNSGASGAWLCESVVPIHSNRSLPHGSWSILTKINVSLYKIGMI